MKISALMMAGMSVCIAFAGTKPQKQSSQPAQSEYNRPGVAIVVKDPQGAVISGAKVALIKQDGKKKTKQKLGITDANGQIFLDGLTTGKYLLEITSQGFRTFRQTVPVQEGKLESIALRLSVDSSITLDDDFDLCPPLVQTESTVSTTFHGDSLPVFMPSRGGYSPIRR